MKLQFKYQKFQADAAKAVADVFDGQPYLAPSYMTGEISGKNSSSEERNFFRMEQSEDRARIKR